MAFENTGAIAIANALGNLGSNIGNAFIKSQDRQAMADLGSMIQSGNLQGAADAAFKSGDASSGISLLKLIDDRDRRAAQQNADAAVFSAINGTSSSRPMSIAGGVPSNDEVSSYIAEAAKSRGIDPNVALKVWSSEGRAGYVGDSGSSFGPLQLHYGNVAKGGNAVGGLGDEFTKTTGLDARNPQTWRQQIDFAFDKAKQGGWGPWHGYKGGQWDGIGGRGVQLADASGSLPQSANIDALMTRRNNIMRALSSQGISDNARAQLNTLLQDTTFQIERSDRLSNQNRPEVKQFGDTVYQVSGGNMRPLQKVDAQKPPTEGQAKAATYAQRMQESEDIINSVDENGKPIWQDAIGSYGQKNRALEYLPVIGRPMMSDNYQRYLDAKERFITSKLRPESGAAIGASEYQREDRALFPQPGDSAKTIRDKALARQKVIKTEAMQATPQFQNDFIGGNRETTVSGNVNAARSIPADVLNEARAAIAVKGRDAVIKRLRENGFDTSGL